MKILNLTARDFGSFSSLSVDLSDRGLLLLDGHNQDEGGSNGAGKSTIVHALCWGIYGKTPEDPPRKADEVIRWGRKSCAVTVTMEVGNRKVRVERYRNDPERASKVYLYFDGEGGALSTNAETQAAIEQAIGLDWATFTSVIIFPQESRGVAAQSGAEQRHIMGKVLGLERLEEAHNRAKHFVNDEQRRLEKLRRTAELANAKLEESTKNLRLLKEKSEDWADDLSRRLSNAKKDLAEITRHKPEEHGLAERLEEVRTEISASRYTDLTKLYEEDGERLRDLGAKIAETKASWRIANAKKVSVVDPQAKVEKEVVCPMCKQDLPGTSKDELLNHYHTMRQEQLAANEKVSAEVAKIGARLKEEEQEFRDLQVRREQTLNALAVLQQHVQLADEIQLQLRNHEVDVERWESRKRDLAQKVKELEVEENPFVGLLDGAEQVIESHKAEILLVTRQIEPVEKTLAKLKFWQDGFGSNGVKQLLYSTVTPYLNERANVYMRELCQNGKIEIKTQRELKSGALKDDLTFEVSYGADSNYSTKSRGERRRADIAIQLALSDLAAARAATPVQFAIWDEPFDNLDPQGAEQVVDLLIQHVVPHKGTVIVTSQSGELKSLFQQTLTVRKRGGVSTL